MKPKTILFFSKAPMNYVMFRPIHARLKHHPALQFVFSRKPQGKTQKLDDLYSAYFSRAKERFLPAWRARIASPDLYVSADMFIGTPRARTKVHIFHGVSFKGKAYSQSILDYDRIFVVGPYMQKNLFNVVS
jgi:hypothetical protein